LTTDKSCYKQRPCWRRSFKPWKIPP